MRTLGVNLLQCKFNTGCYSLPMEEDLLMRQIFLTHDPDGRHFDSTLLLQAMENIMCYATPSDVSDIHLDDINICYNEVVGSNETLAQTIYKISREVLCKCLEDGHSHEKAMALFDMLGHYRWDAKLVLILAAFATSYGEFWLVMQLYPHNLLAAAVALLKQFPCNLGMLKPRFKALSLLVNSMVDVTKYIIEFEGLPLQQELLDYKEIADTKSLICIAAYWIFQSVLACSSQITDLIAMKTEQVYSNSTTIAVWELSSLVCRLNSKCSDLKRQVDVCHQQIETRLYMKLVDVFKGTHSNNQEILYMLLGLKDKLPLKNSSSQTKVGISELKDRVVMLLISRPELLPLEGLLLLVQQTQDHPRLKNLEESYEVVWVPIPSLDSWSLEEERFFIYISNSLPWLSVSQPWLLSSAVTKFIKQEWNFKQDPLIVVLDLEGRVTNFNAFDMVLIWGPKAFPFSASKEKELWEMQHWTLEFIIDGLDPLLTMMVEQGKNICIFGSNNRDWITEVHAKMQKMRNAGLQLEMVYVGSRSTHSEQLISNTSASLGEEMLRGSLTSMKRHFFWRRLESMEKAILQLDHAVDGDSNSTKLSVMLDPNKCDGKGWAVIGGGPSADSITLQGTGVLECFDLFPVWGEKMANLGIVGAIKAAIEPPLPEGNCHHPDLPYDESLYNETAICGKCRRPMVKYILYKCDSSE